MFRGDPINSTEQRAVLHTALRSDFAGPAGDAGGSARLAPEAYRASPPRCAAASKLGVTGKKFKHVVNIGIGGSDLGPLLVCDALRAEWSGGHHAAFRVQCGSHAARGFDPQHRSRGDAGHRLLQDLHHAGDAGQRQCGPRLDRRRAGREVPGQSLRRGVDQCRGHGCLRHRRRASLHHVGLGRRPLFGVVGHRPHRRNRRRQRALRRIPAGRERHRPALHARARSRRTCRC